MLMRLLLLLLLTLPLSAAPVPKVKEADTLSGNWEVTERRTGKVAPKGAVGIVWAVRGQEVTIYPQGLGKPSVPTTSAKYQLTPPEKAKKGEVDYHLTYPDGKPTILYRGRYEVDGDTLRFCYTTDATADRPADFEPRDKVVVYTFKRVPDAK